MRCVQDSTVVPHKFRSSEQVETVELDLPQNHTVLYVDGQTVHLMHEETFEQMEVTLSAFGHRAAWLQDGMPVRVRSHAGSPLELTLPPRGAYEVVETLPGGRESKSDNAKPAKLANGVSADVCSHAHARCSLQCIAPAHAAALPPHASTSPPALTNPGQDSCAALCGGG
jgi:elongation factor P